MFTSTPSRYWYHNDARCGRDGATRDQQSCVENLYNGGGDLRTYVRVLGREALLSAGRGILHAALGDCYIRVDGRCEFIHVAYAGDTSRMHGFDMLLRQPQIIRRVPETANVSAYGNEL